MSSGFREIEHTADWAIEIWGPDLQGLFLEAARGMYALMGIRSGKLAQNRTLQLQAGDAESLLVHFLSELLFLLEQDQLSFDTIKLEIDGTRLDADLKGSTVLGYSKEIKAVTYHGLVICHDDGNYSATLVFDV